MTVVSNVGAVGVPAGRRVRGRGPAFHLSEEPAAAEAALVPALSGLCGLLVMQEAESAAVRDREAHRHGSALLDGLADLQRQLLGGTASGGLDGLAARSRCPPSAADPSLSALLRAVQLRVDVELARHDGLRHPGNT